MEDVEFVEFVVEQEKVRVVEAAAVKAVLNASDDLIQVARYTGAVQADTLCVPGTAADECTARSGAWA